MGPTSAYTWTILGWKYLNHQLIEQGNSFPGKKWWLELRTKRTYETKFLPSRQKQKQVLQFHLMHKLLHKSEKWIESATRNFGQAHGLSQNLWCKLFNCSNVVYSPNFTSHLQFNQCNIQCMCIYIYISKFQHVQIGSIEEYCPTYFQKQEKPTNPNADPVLQTDVRASRINCRCGVWSVKCKVWSVKCGVYSIKCEV